MNTFKKLIELMPNAPLMVATVSIAHSDDTMTVTYPGGSSQRVRGKGFAVNSKVFVKGDLIEGQAPSLPLVSIEI